MDDKLANPAPLGLMGFGMTTILLNLHNAGLWGVGSMILGMGLYRVVADPLPPVSTETDVT